MNSEHLDFRMSYDGSIFSNARTISDSMAIFNSNKSKITLNELFQILEFIECIALSDKLHFDASIPQRALGKLTQNIEQLTKTTDIKNDALKPFVLDSTKKELLSSQSFENAILSINKLIEDEELLKSTPLALSGSFTRKQIEIFDNVLHTRNEIFNTTQQEEFLTEVLANRNITGRRFLYNLCKPHNVKHFNSFFKFTLSLQEQERGSFYSKVINTYRSHLLNKYAEEAGSAYQPTDYSKWAVSELYAKQAWRDVTSRLQENTLIGKDIYDIKNQNGFTGEPLIPPFALGLLMHSNKKIKGLDIINFALEDTKKREFRSFRKKLWDASFADENQYQEFIKLVEQSMEEYKRDVFNDKPFIGGKSRFALINKIPKNIISDTILGVSVSVASTALQVSTTLGLDTLAFVIGKHIYNTTGKRGFISFYKDQRKNFKNVDMPELSKKVQSVFGRELVY